MKKLGVFVTHPIPYFVPTWRQLSNIEDIDLTVYFFSRAGIELKTNAQFGQAIKWDLPLLSGYKYQFLADWSADECFKKRCDTLSTVVNFSELDCVLVHGYVHRFSRDVVSLANKKGLGTIIRGPFTSLRNRQKSKSTVGKICRDLYLRWFLRKFRAVAYIGQRAKEELIRLGTEERRLYYAPYSIDPDNFEVAYNTLDRQKLRETYKIPEDNVVLLVCGVLHPRKNIDVVLDAIGILDNSEKVWLALVGSGPMATQLEEKSRRILGNRVIMPGFVNQSSLPEYYKLADIFVFPSLYDCWGIVLNEAMNFGLAPICSRQVSAQADLIHDGNTGYSFDPNDATELSILIGKLLCRDTRASIGRNARELAKTFTPQLSANGIANAVRAVC